MRHERNQSAARRPKEVLIGPPEPRLHIPQYALAQTNNRLWLNLFQYVSQVFIRAVAATHRETTHRVHSRAEEQLADRCMILEHSICPIKILHYSGMNIIMPLPPASPYICLPIPAILRQRSKLPAIPHQTLKPGTITGQSRVDAHEQQIGPTPRANGRRELQIPSALTSLKPEPLRTGLALEHARQQTRISLFHDLCCHSARHRYNLFLRRFLPLRLPSAADLVAPTAPRSASILLPFAGDASARYCSMSDQPPRLPETVALVGQATLIKWPDGKYELLDRGSAADRKEILAWVAVYIEGAQVVIK